MSALIRVEVVDKETSRRSLAATLLVGLLAVLGVTLFDDMRLGMLAPAASPIQTLGMLLRGIGFGMLGFGLVVLALAIGGAVMARRPKWRNFGELRQGWGRGASEIEAMQCEGAKLVAGGGECQ